MVPAPISSDEERRRKTVGINAETVTNVTSTDFPGHYPGENHAWSLEFFKKTFDIHFYKNDPREASFSLVHIDASLANAFRRILLAEIPTLAIETVFIENNTSIIQDEVLAARLGLVPLAGSPRLLKFLQYQKKRAPTIDDDAGYGDKAEVVATDNNTIVLRLKHECTWNDRNGSSSSSAESPTEPHDLYIGSNVYAKEITFEPQGRQAQYCDDAETAGSGITAVHPDILIAKMRPGQVIDLHAHAIKGIGADHAKFSPVATATYRLLPTIDITQPILGADAEKFARCFPKGVIALERVTDDEADEMGGPYEGMAGQVKAVVRDPMRDTVSRECLRHEEFVGKVKLGRQRDHFIFNVESTGQVESDALFLESVKILKAKCKLLKLGVDNMLR